MYCIMGFSFLQYLERYLLVRYSKGEWLMGMKIDEGPYKNAAPYASESEVILTISSAAFLIGAGAISYP